MFKPERVSSLIARCQADNDKLRLDDIAMEWKIPRITLDKVKSGRVDPQVSTVEKIAVGAGVDMNYLFDHDDWPTIFKQEKPDPNLDKYEKALKRLSKQLDVDFETLVSTKYIVPKATQSVEQPTEIYDSSKEKIFEQLVSTQRELIEAQRELMEIKTENEHLKNGCVPGRDAIAG